MSGNIDLGLNMQSSGRPVEDVAPIADAVVQTQEELDAAAAAASGTTAPDDDPNKPVVKTQEELDAEAKALEEKGNEGLTDEEIQKNKEAQDLLDKQAKDNEDALKLKLRQEFLAEHGITDEQDFKTRLAALNNKPETEEEKTLRIEKEGQQLLAFAIEHKHVTTQDISARETLSSLTDQDIAYNAFKAEYSARNKDRKVEGTDTPNPPTEDEMKEEFETLYHLNSANATLKALGEKQIAKLGKETRDETEQKFDHAKQQFATHQHKQINVPAFQNFTKDAIAKGIPTEITVPNGDDSFVFKTQDADGKPLYDMAEIEKLFVNDPVFKSFLKDKDGDLTELRTYYADQITRYIENKNRAEINRQMREINFEAGTKKGSTTGAAAPFKQTKDVPPVAVPKTELSAEQKSRMAKDFANPFSV